MGIVSFFQVKTIMEIKEVASTMPGLLPAGDKFSAHWISGRQTPPPWAVFPVSAPNPRASAKQDFRTF
jgi:hypothetical protein